jgi:Transposase, Mutator family
MVVRNGYHQQRDVLTAAGAVAVAAPRVNDCRIDDSGERQRFSSAILPTWARKSPQITEVLPLLYLHGLSTGDFGAALEQFLGSGAGLSAASTTRLTARWQDEAKAFLERDLSGTDFVYLWVDGRVNAAPAEPWTVLMRASFIVPRCSPASGTERIHHYRTDPVALLRRSAPRQSRLRRPQTSVMGEPADPIQRPSRHSFHCIPIRGLLPSGHRGSSTRPSDSMRRVRLSSDKPERRTMSSDSPDMKSSSAPHPRRTRSAPRSAIA